MDCLDPAIRDSCLPGVADLVNLQKTMENHHFQWEIQLFLWEIQLFLWEIQLFLWENQLFQWEIQLFLWSFSIANCNKLPEGISQEISEFSEV